MYGCVEDHYRKRALLSKDAEEHLKVCGYFAVLWHERLVCRNSKKQS